MINLQCTVGGVFQALPHDQRRPVAFDLRSREGAAACGGRRGSSSRGVLQGATAHHHRTVLRRSDLRGVRGRGGVYFVGAIPHCLEVDRIWIGPIGIGPGAKGHGG